MDQGNVENTPEGPQNIPAKRRRGRPRKDPSQGITRRVSATLTPGTDRTNGTRSLPLDAIEDTDNGFVGQPVTGVIESSFDAGFLLSVRIGNSGTNLRGVVFKQGHYVPISSENDVAPHVQMIRRNEISLPLVNQAQSRGRHRRSRGRNARHLPPTQLPTNMAPVALQPMDSTNNMFPIQAPQVPQSSGQFADPRYMQTHLGDSNLQPVMNQVGNGSFYQVGENVNSMNQSGPSGPNVAHDGGGADGEFSGEESDDVEEPLDAMPLQAIHTYVQNQQSQPVQNPLETPKIGEMTELLQAVQKNVPGNPLLEGQNMMLRHDNAQP